MTKEEYKNRFEKLYQLLTKAHLCFYVWRGLKDSKYQPQFNRNKNFWGAVMFSLESSWLQSLANIYENSDYSKKDRIISVYSLIKNQKDNQRKIKAEAIVSQNQAVINNISVLRGNQLAHFNANHLLNPESILKKYPVKYEDVEKLLGITEELLHCLHPESNHSFSFEGFDEESEKDSKRVMNKIEYFLKQEKRHYGKIRSRGDMKFIPFPPNEKNQE